MFLVYHKSLIQFYKYATSKLNKLQITRLVILSTTRCSTPFPILLQGSNTNAACGTIFSILLLYLKQLVVSFLRRRHGFIPRVAVESVVAEVILEQIFLQNIGFPLPFPSMFPTNQVFGAGTVSPSQVVVLRNSVPPHS
jgi:hypothetical protein